MGNLESSSDDIAAINGGPGKIARHHKVHKQITDTFRTHIMLLRPKSKSGKGDEMGAIKDILFVIICPCGIHQEERNLRRSYAKCRARCDALHECVQYILVLLIYLGNLSLFGLPTPRGISIRSSRTISSYL